MDNNLEPSGEKGLPKFQQSNVEDNMRKLDSYEDISTASRQWERSSHPLTHRAQSTSCLDLNTPTDVDKLRSLLPSYRPAPDYETAIQQKYRNSSGTIPTGEPLRNTHAILYSSQPEIHQTDAYTSHLRYPDVTHNNIEQKNLITSIYNSNYPQAQNLTDLTEGMRLLHLYKPPPPYPSSRISSNSTPDLAGISQHAKPQNNFINMVSGSSPDLVSNGNLLNQLKQYGQALYPHQQGHPVHRSQSYLPAEPQHGTYENLTTFFENNLLGRPQAVIVDNPNITKHIKKVYDEHGNIIYCMPANMKQILQENQLPNNGFVVTCNQNVVVAHATTQDLHNSSEPIYENIPLPWQNDNNGQIRSRTQSIQSAPDVNPNKRSESKENLYANINRVNSSSKTDLNSSTGSTSQSLNTTQLSAFSVTNSIENSSMNRSNLFASNSSTECFGDESTTSNSSSGKTKKKRWGILMGRSKSNEKVKSATLGREKEKKEKSQGNNKHRWSTGLPRLHPLPPSISKETMVSLLRNKIFIKINDIVL